MLTIAERAYNPSVGNSITITELFVFDALPGLVVYLTKQSII
jgi:hypothetical protein